jgi:DNA-binding transcriptional MerR regulator
MNLSPTETATRLGVSIKALRLYESRGLLKPLRSEAGWRIYGPDQVARLHQILALKRLGLPLARIATILAGAGALEPVLELQERVLAREGERLARALELVRAARAKLRSGQSLSVDDLATLTTETAMTGKATLEDMRDVLEPITHRHYTPADRAALAARPYDQAEIGRQWMVLMEEARVLMAAGDPASPAAQDLGRRWKALYEQFTGGNKNLESKVNAVWRDAFADPAAAARLPVSQEMFAFIGAALKAADTH